MKFRALPVIFVGFALLVAAVATETLTQPRGWVRGVAFLGWCVAAFGLGMYYRDFIQRARQRRGRR